ncbi:hypothetical protein QTP88_017771 [Uroleucon formosanum]
MCQLLCNYCNDCTYLVLTTNGNKLRIIVYTLLIFSKNSNYLWFATLDMCLFLLPLKQQLKTRFYKIYLHLLKHFECSASIRSSFQLRKKTFYLHLMLYLMRIDHFVANGLMTLSGWNIALSEMLHFVMYVGFLVQETVPRMYGLIPDLIIGKNLVQNLENEYCHTKTTISLIYSPFPFIFYDVARNKKQGKLACCYMGAEKISMSKKCGNLVK